MEPFKLFWDHLKGEWAVIKTAPLTFFAAVSVGVWGGYQFSSMRYEGSVQNLDTAIKAKDATIAEMRLQAESTGRESKYVKTANDADAIYQFNRKVGLGNGVDIQLSLGKVIFGTIIASAEFNSGAEFEFRDLMLKITKIDISGQERSFGVLQKQTFAHVTAAIVGRR